MVSTPVGAKVKARLSVRVFARLRRAAQALWTPCPILTLSGRIAFRAVTPMLMFPATLRLLGNVKPPLDDILAVAILTLTMIGVIVLLLVILSSARKVQQRAKKHQYLLCRHCAYPVDHNQADEGQCPECGEAYYRDDVRLYWGG